MTRLKIFGALGTCALLLTACGGGGAADNGGGGEADPNATMRFSTSYGTSSWDPHKTKVTSDVILLNNVYEPLVRHDTAGKPEPALAESWQLSDGAKKFTMKLRQGVKFTDGEPFNAAAVKKNLERAKEKDSITATQLALVTGINTPDDNTVELSLSRPGGALPLVFSDLPGMMVSPKAMANPEALKTTPVGAGPFKLASQKPGAKYDLDANPDYWNKGTPKIKKLSIDIMVDPQTRLNAVQSDQVDLAVTASNIIEPAKQMGLKVDATPSLNQYVLFFNQKRSEFGKPDVRKAIFEAIDREELVKGALEGQGVAGSQYFPKGYFANDPNQPEMYPPNLDKAKESLAKAGVPNGFTFEAVVLNQPVYITQAEIIKARLAKLGVTMNLRPLSGSEVSPTFYRGEADAILTALVARPDPTQLLQAYFSKDSVTNPSHQDIPGFEAAIDQANSSDDPTVRGPLIAKAQQLALADANLIPLAHYTLGCVMNQKVQGYKRYPGGDEFRTVTLSK